MMQLTGAISQTAPGDLGDIATQLLGHVADVLLTTGLYGEAVALELG